MILKLMIIHLFLFYAIEGGIIQQLLLKHQRKQTNQHRRNWQYQNHYLQHWQHTRYTAPDADVPHQHIPVFPNEWNNYGIVYQCLDGVYNQMYNPWKSGNSTLLPSPRPYPMTPTITEENNHRLPPTVIHTPSTPIRFPSETSTPVRFPPAIPIPFPSSTTPPIAFSPIQPNPELKPTDSPTTKQTIFFDFGTTESPEATSEASDETFDERKRFQGGPVRSNQKDCEEEKKRDQIIKRGKTNNRRNQSHRSEPVQHKPDYFYESDDDDYHDDDILLNDNIEKETHEVNEDSEEDYVDDDDYPDTEEEIKTVRNKKLLKFPDRDIPSRRGTQRGQTVSRKRAQSQREERSKTASKGGRKITQKSSRRFPVRESSRVFKPIEIPVDETPRRYRNEGGAIFKRRVISRDDLTANRRENSKVLWEKIRPRRKRS